MNAFQSPKLYSYAPTKQGIATADNERFLRLWFEVSNENVAIGIKSHDESYESRKKWYPYSKGGTYRKWFGNREYYINWEKDGLELKQFKKSVIRNTNKAY